ncbi:hypothetical protein [Succinivibrio dextrinosolvens]|uniref:hypothetical protein n=1 Tax=Succinivibrio dextrinosolvens TaxID=83771 RepID=UPI0019232541|nr:hypothetical protein [Succinivibrio dextrinosolvens]
MLNIEENFAKTLLKDAAVVLFASNDDCRAPDNVLNSIGTGNFKLYRLSTGQHLMEAHIIDGDFTEYNLLETPAEVIQAFFNLGKGNELSSYLKTLYRSDDEEDVTITLPKKLLQTMKRKARGRNQDLQSFIISQLDDSCLNLQ